MSSLNELYSSACATPSNIHEHLPTLYKFASMCSSVAEFSDETYSSYGLLAGLASTTVDEMKYTRVGRSDPASILAVALGSNIRSEWIQGDSATAVISPHDMLFINSWHVYGQLLRELCTNAKLIKKYIIMHNTTVDEKDGESVRCGMDIEAQVKRSGYDEIEIRHGLGLAIKEFLRIRDFRLHKITSKIKNVYF